MEKNSKMKKSSSDRDGRAETLARQTFLELRDHFAFGAMHAGDLALDGGGFLARRFPLHRLAQHGFGRLAVRGAYVQDELVVVRRVAAAARADDFTVRRCHNG